MEYGKVLSKILKFQREPRRMSRRALKTFTLKYGRPFKIWGRTKDGIEYEGRELFSFAGPSRAANSPFSRYNYPAKGYMIFYDMRKGAYRTFIYDNIYAFEQDGIRYEIV